MLATKKRAFVLGIENDPDFFGFLKWRMATCGKHGHGKKKSDLTRKIKALILNKYIRVNVRQRAFKYWFAQTSGFVLMATVAILYLTTKKNHPVKVSSSQALKMNHEARF